MKMISLVETETMMSEEKIILSEASKGFERTKRKEAELAAATKTNYEEMKYFANIRKGAPSEQAAASVKKSAGKEEVIEAVIAVLTENRPQAIPLEDLKSLVQERLKKQKFALVGTFRFFEKYLQEAETITATENGSYGLAAADVVKIA